MVDMVTIGAEAVCATLKLGGDREHEMMRGVGRTLEERLRIEAEMTLSMFMRRDSHTIGAAAFKAGNLSPEWPHHGL